MLLIAFTQEIECRQYASNLPVELSKIMQQTLALTVSTLSWYSASRVCRNKQIANRNRAESYFVII